MDDQRNEAVSLDVLWTPVSVLSNPYRRLEAFDICSCRNHLVYERLELHLPSLHITSVVCLINLIHVTLTLTFPIRGLHDHSF